MRGYGIHNSKIAEIFTSALTKSKFSPTSPKLVLTYPHIVENHGITMAPLFVCLFVCLFYLILKHSFQGLVKDLDGNEIKIKI